MRWYLKVMKSYANFEGRARRKEFWMFYLFTAIFEIIAITLDNVLGLTFKLTGIYQYVGIILLIYGLFSIIPYAAVIVRRLHDQDKSGAWYFISFVPIIGGLLRLILMGAEGTYGPNQYGEDPKQQGESAFNVDAPVLNSLVASAPNAETQIAYQSAFHTPNANSSEHIGYIIDFITVTGLHLLKTEVNSGEPILAEVTCQNSADMINDYLLTLYVNGFALQKQQIEIAPKSRCTVTMQVPQVLDKGEYIVRVGSYLQKLVIL